MVRQSLLLFFFIFTAAFASAQIPSLCPSDNTPAADFCEDMCIYCNLQAYTGTTAGYTSQPPASFCGTIENEQWLGFVAGATTAFVTVIPSNCQIGNGVQVALYPECFSSPLPGGCNGGFAGGGNIPMSIAVNLTPGEVYYLMIDAYAGDICDFSVIVTPPGAALSGTIISQQVGLCPGQTFFYEGVEYTAPAVIKDTLQGSGDCDTILLYNLTALPYNTASQNFKFCPGDTVFVNGMPFTEPGTYVDQIPSTTGGCDTIMTYTFEHSPQPVSTETIVLHPFEPVVINGNIYFAPDTVQGTIPASVGCDTIVTYFLVLDASVPDTCVETKSFLKLLGKSLSVEHGNVLIPASDGDFYLAGEQNTESLLMKVTSNGAVVWARTFQPIANLTTHITDLAEDSDGMLVGCAIVGEGDINLKSYAFRYDPSADAFIWSRRLEQQSPEAFAIVEKQLGGNFLLLTSPQLALNVDDAEIWELDRNTGALVGGLTSRYNLGVSDVWNSMTIYNGALYVIGRHIPVNQPIPPLSKMRMGLSRLDLNTGNPVWSRLSHIDTSANATLFGQDLIIHDNALLAVYNGNDSGAPDAFPAMFLQKTTLDGNLLWVKRYDLPVPSSLLASDIQAVNDGYLIIASALVDMNWSKIIVKTDFDGNVVWAKRLSAATLNLAITSGLTLGQHQSSVVNDVLYLTATSTATPANAVLIKMTSDGEISDSCGYIEPFNVLAQAVPNAVNIPVQVAKNQFLGQSSNTPTAAVQGDVPVATYCVACLLNCDDTLDLGPDIILCKDSTLTFNAGSDFVSYLWQDGSTDSTFTTSVPDIYWVEVTNECGEKQRDSVLLTVSLAGDIKLPDSTICIGESLTLTVQDFDTYLWSPSTGLSCDTCPTVTIQPGVTTTYTLFAENQYGCSKRDTFTIEVRPLETRSETIEFCPGESVTIDGIVYTQSGTVVDTVPASVGCDTIVTYTLILLPQPTFSQTIEFCAGESVTIGGIVYTQPGTVIDTIPASVGCDTIATYILKYATTPNSSVSIDCPDDIDIASNPGTGPVVVNYNLPTASSDCDCPGIALTLMQGLPSGSAFPVGTTSVCYQAKDSCGNTASCCFEVTIREEQPCDVKTIGCMKYELLTITRGSTSKNLTYRIRVTNNCTNKMVYTAIQLPNGVVAKAPADNSVFTAESGRKYDVRNPNYSPFYSIRFKSKTDAISNGQSDIFEYTLPPQINPDYIHITSRVELQTFYEAHLNTFKCPIEIVQDKPENRQDLIVNQLSGFKVFPNPTSGALFADFSDWEGERLQVQVFSSQGQRVQLLTVQASDAAQEIQLPEGLSSGLYFLEVLRENGERQAVRFVVQH